MDISLFRTDEIYDGKPDDFGEMEVIMDKRMYRGNSGNNCCGRNSSQFRQNEPVCGDICCDHVREDICEKEKRDGDFGRFPLGMCYVPWQCFRNLYDNEFEAIANGTLFRELDLKWYGRGCK